MQIILLHDVEKVGRRGETVSVADGYARNYLFPEGMAVRADTAKKKELEMRLKSFEARDDRDRESAETQATSMRAISLKLQAAASDEGRLFGSITPQIIVGELAGLGHEIDPKQVLLDEPIRQLGEYTVPVRLHRDVVAEVGLTVEASG